MANKDPEDPPIGESSKFAFDTERVPTSDRFDVAREVLCQAFPGCELLPTSTREFGVSLGARQLGQVAFGHGTTNTVKARFGSSQLRQYHAALGPSEAEGTLWVFGRGRAQVRQGAFEGEQGIGSAW